MVRFYSLTVASNGVLNAIGLNEPEQNCDYGGSSEIFLLLLSHIDLL
jgi:hypothetical protein